MGTEHLSPKIAALETQTDLNKQKKLPTNLQDEEEEKNNIGNKRNAKQAEKTATKIQKLNQ